MSRVVSRLPACRKRAGNHRHGTLLTLDEERIVAEAEQRGWRMVGQELRVVREYRG